MLRLALAVLALAAAGTGAWLLFVHDDRYVVRAEFADGAGLRPKSAVKIDGVAVGSVDDLRVVRGNRALAVIKLDDEAAPVGRDARATIRPANLIGEKFIDLQPGDPRRPAPRHFTIPVQRTGAPVELDDLIDTLDSPTRVRLGLLIRESGIAMAGRGADFAELLEEMPTALDRSGRLVAAFAADNRALGRMVQASDRVVARIADERAALGRLVDETAGTLDTLASRRRRLSQTVTAAAPALAQLRRTLRNLDDTGARLRPAADGLRRTAPGLGATLRALPGFADAARPLLTVARAAAPSLDRLGREAAPVVRRLRPAAAALASYADASGELSQTFDQGFPDFLGMMEGWARAIQTRDGLGHLFRTQSVITDAQIKTLMRGYVRRRPHRQRRVERPGERAAVPEARAPEQPGPPRSADRPRLPRLPQLPLPKLPELPQLPEVPRVAPSGGLDDTLDYLLGP